MLLCGLQVAQRDKICIIGSIRKNTIMLYILMCNFMQNTISVEISLFYEIFYSIKRQKICIAVPSTQGLPYPLHERSSIMGVMHCVILILVSPVVQNTTSLTSLLFPLNGAKQCTQTMFFPFEKIPMLSYRIKPKLFILASSF